MRQSRVLGCLTLGQAEILVELDRRGRPCSAVALGSHRGTHHVRSLRSLVLKGLVVVSEGVLGPEYSLTTKGRGEVRVLEAAAALPEARLQGGVRVRESLYLARGLVQGC